MELLLGPPETVSCSVTSSGRSFHVCGPATGEARLPTVCISLMEWNTLQANVDPVTAHNLQRSSFAATVSHEHRQIHGESDISVKIKNVSDDSLMTSYIVGKGSGKNSSAMAPTALVSDVLFNGSALWVDSSPSTEADKRRWFVKW